MQPQQSPQQAYPYILYLNPQTHINEHKLVKNAQLENFILLQDVALAKENLPDWLSVLPALVNTKEMKAYRGPTCFKKLLEIDLPPEHLKRLLRNKQNKFE